MKLSLLLLLVLPSVSLQAVLENSSQPENASLLNPDLEVKADRSTLTHRRFLPPAKLKHKRQAQLPRSDLYISKVMWKIWPGSLPKGSVSIYNEYANRIDYVCQYDCEAGFYNPDIGPYCNYPYGNKERQASYLFQILVNIDNFENLQWKDGSFGSVPSKAIQTCENRDIYVGKNQYGLGKVHVSHRSFYLPWEGSEYWYQFHYQVLTMNLDIQSQRVFNVKYNTDAATIISYAPENLYIATINNYECNPVRKETSLSKTIRVEKRWDISSGIMFGITTSFTGGVPFITSGNIDISTTMSFQFSGGQTNTEENTLSTAIEVTVPPNHSCKGRMVGHKYKINVPFTAQLSRTYRNGATTETSISGTFDGVQVGEVHSEIDRCKPVPDAKLCLNVEKEI